MGRVLSRGYCAFCKAERSYILKKHIGFFEVVLALFFSFSLGGALWTFYEPKILVIFVIATSASEFFIYSRWRSHIVCRKCGFDPVLYNSAPNRARDKVKAFYAERLTRPEFLLSNSPLLELHKESLRRESLSRRLHRVKGGSKGPLAPLESSRAQENLLQD